MDTISSAYPPVAPPPAQGGSKTMMYVMVFFMCLISVVAGVMYTNFTKMQSEANAKAKAREELIKSKEEMLKKAQARVDSELNDAAKRVREAKEMQRKALEVGTEAVNRKREAEAAMKKAQETNDANLKKLAEEKKRLADEAQKKVDDANKKAAAAVEDAKVAAKKATGLQSRLTQAEGKIRGTNFARAAAYGGVPGYYRSGAQWAGDQLNVSDPNACRNIARQRGFASWGHRNVSHPTPKYRNSCYFYKKSGKYTGDGNDSIHMVGCAFGGHPKSGCRTPTYGFQRWNAFWRKLDFPGNDIWAQHVSNRRRGRRGRGRNNRNAALNRCAKDNRCAALTCNGSGTRCWAKGKLGRARGHRDRYTWRAQRGWR
jgi:hypothetical protein